MTAGVISHRGAPRKRAPSRGWTARRFVAVALTLVALVAIAWVAPYLRPTPTKIANPPQLPAVSSAAPPLPLPAAAETPAPVVRARPLSPRRSGVPLDAQVSSPGEDFEVLSASELDAISQASGE